MKARIITLGTALLLIAAVIAPTAEAGRGWP